MPRYSIAPAASDDMISIMERSIREFGLDAALRYETLSDQAISDVVEDPERAGSHPFHELGRTARTYHLSHSRRRVSNAAQRVRHPRHFLLF